MSEGTGCILLGGQGPDPTQQKLRSLSPALPGHLAQPCRTLEPSGPREEGWQAPAERATAGPGGWASSSQAQGRSHPGLHSGRVGLLHSPGCSELLTRASSIVCGASGCFHPFQLRPALSTLKIRRLLGRRRTPDGGLHEARASNRTLEVSQQCPALMAPSWVDANGLASAAHTEDRKVGLAAAPAGNNCGQTSTAACATRGQSWVQPTPATRELGCGARRLSALRSPSRPSSFLVASL